MRFIEGRTRAGPAGLIMAWFGLFVAAGGVMIARLGNVGPQPVLAVIGAGWALSGIALVLSVVGLVAVWRKGARGAPSAFSGLLISCLALTWPLNVGVQIWRAPGLSEISTDTVDPPAFPASPEAVAARGGVALPAPPAGQRALQDRGQIHALPLFLDQPPAEAVNAAEEAARALGWTLTGVVTNPDGGGQFEAIAKSDLLRFPQYVAVRIRPTGDGSQLDVRVVSEFGQLSPAANFRRIIDLHEAVQEGEDG